jgi:polyketide synthase 12
MTRVSNCLGEVAIANHNFVVPILASLAFTQAACLPVAYTTAYYGLMHLGRLMSGESVLVHSTASGVGTAAVQIAKRFGARVVALREALVISLGI